MNYLNENIAFISETLKYWKRQVKHIDENKLNENSIEVLKNHLDISIKSCLMSEQTNDKFLIDAKKYEIFSYLFSEYFLSSRNSSTNSNAEIFFYLAIENELLDICELVECLNHLQEEILTQKLFDYISFNLQTKNGSTFWQKCLKMLVNICIFFIRKGNYSNLFVNLIFNQHEDLKIEDDGYFFNKCLNLMLETLELHNWRCKKKNFEEITSFEKALSERYYQSHLQIRLKYCLKLIDVISRNFQVCAENLKIINLNQTLYLLSFLKHEIECFSDKQTDPDMFTLEILFFNYTKRSIETNYKLVFNSFFIIKHELYGFRRSLEENILKADFKTNGFKFESLVCLESVKEYLKNVSDMYMLLKLIEQLIGSSYFVQVERLFWYLFDILSFDQKVLLVYEVYDKLELIFDQNNSLICLYNSQFESDLTLAINQISNNIDQSNLIIDKLLRLMIISLPMVMHKLITNCLSNKAQINALINLLSKFPKIIFVKSIKSTRHNLLFDILHDYLQKSIENKNEKLFQNFLTFLKAFIKPSQIKTDTKLALSTMLIDASEFYSKVVSQYLLTVEYHSLYVFEIFEALIKATPLSVAHASYFLKVINSLHFEKRNRNLTIKLKEKCFNLIKKIKKILINSNKLENDDIQWLKLESETIYWPLTFLVCDLTRIIYLPKSLKDLEIKINHDLQIEYLNDSTEPRFEALIELFALGFSIEHFSYGLLQEQISTEELLKHTISSFNQNRTPNEIESIFKFIAWIVLNDRLATKMHDKLVSGILQEENEFRVYADLLSFLTELIYVLSDIKLECFHLILTTFFNQIKIKLAIYLEETNASEVFQFSVEILKNISKLNEQTREKKVFNKKLLHFCRLLESDIDINFTYLKHLSNEVFELLER